MANDSTDGIPAFLLRDDIKFASDLLPPPDVKLYARLHKSTKIATALLAYYEKGNPTTFSQKHDSMVRALTAVGVADV